MGRSCVSGAALILLGAGGHARVVADLARMAGWRIAGFVDPARPAGEDIQDAAVLGADFTENAGWMRDCFMIAAIGDNVVRRREHGRLIAAGARVPALVPPSAVVSAFATLEPGAVVMAGAVVQAGAWVGAAAVINTAASVDHDCHIGEAALIAPGATLCGGVRVGALTLIGAGATVAPNVRIGRAALVGVGAVVVDDLPDDARLKPWRRGASERGTVR